MRVSKNFDDKDLQAGIVIPSYDEGTDILRTVHAWALQSIESGVRCGLFVVVNNSKKSPAKVKDSNKLTYELIDSLLDPDACPSMKLYDDQWKEFKKLKELVQDSRFRIALIDLWSKHHAPEKCNVGMARDVGARVASEYVEDDGFLVMSDADTVPNRKYLFHASFYLRTHSDAAALRGNVYADGKDTLSEDRLTLMRLVHTLEQFMRLYSLDTDFGKFERKPFPHLAGSNSVVRKSVYELVGGIPHINGAEDTELSRKILRKGLEIKNLGRKLAVDTSDRVSLRTDPGHGMGQAVKEADDYHDTPWDAPVLSLQASRFTELLLEALAEANQEDWNDKSHWKLTIVQMLVRKGAYDLDDAQLERLWQINQSDPTLVDVHFNRPLLIEAERIAEEIYGKLPFSQALVELKYALGMIDQRALATSYLEAYMLRPSVSAGEYLRKSKKELLLIEGVLEDQRCKPKPEWAAPRRSPQEFPSEHSEFMNRYAELMLYLYFFLQGLFKKSPMKS